MVFLDRIFRPSPLQETDVDLTSREFKGIRAPVGKALPEFQTNQPTLEGKPFAAAFGGKERRLATTQTIAPLATTRSTVPQATTRSTVPLVDSIFGTNATQEEAIDLAPEEFKGVRPVVGEALTEFQTNQPTAEGPFAAALTDTERGLAARATTQSLAPNPGRDALVRTLNEGGARNPLIQANIRAAQRPIEEEFQTSRESLRGAFARAGQRPGGRRGSSQFQKILARTGRATSQKLASAAAQITGADVNRRRNQQQKAIATSLGVEQAEIKNISAALSAAGVEREVLDAAISRAAEQDIKGLDQLLNAIRIGGAAGRATIVRLAAVAPGDGALSDITALVGGFFFGPAGAQAGQAGGTAIEDAFR